MSYRVDIKGTEYWIYKSLGSPDEVFSQWAEYAGPMARETAVKVCAELKQLAQERDAARAEVSDLQQQSRDDASECHKSFAILCDAIGKPWGKEHWPILRGASVASADLSCVTEEVVKFIAAERERREKAERERDAAIARVKELEKCQK